VREERRFGLLLIAALASLGVEGIAHPSSFQRILVTALSAVTLLLALRAAEVRPWLVRLAAIVAGVVFLLAIVRAGFGGIGEGAARAMNAALIAAGPPAVAIGVVRELRTAGRVRMQAVMGVLSLYVLLGLFFAFVYGAIDRLGGDPFFEGGHLATIAHCVYFSFITLATVGYGDFVARSDLGHTLAVFESLLGQIYLVTVVSLIVGNLRRPTPPTSQG
jgi:hypothetical protein